MLRSRRWRVLAALLSLAAVVGGSLTAADGFAAQDGPAAAVTGYYHALERGDAATALAYGPIPAGSRTLLSPDALRAQLRVAAMRDFSVDGVDRDGPRASVQVSYELGFPDGSHRTADSVEVRQVGGRWQLAQVAVATRLELTSATQRAAVLGHLVPATTQLLFPGAAPVEFDTDYLHLSSAAGTVDFGSPAVTRLTPAVTDAGRAAAVGAVRAELARCLVAHPATTCPLPSERTVPGTVHATVVGDPAQNVQVALGLGAVGTLQISGSIPVRARFTELDFRDRAVTRTGRVELLLDASAVAVAPLRPTWSV